MRRNFAPQFQQAQVARIERQELTATQLATENTPTKNVLGRRLKSRSRHEHLVTNCVLMAA